MGESGSPGNIPVRNISVSQRELSIMGLDNSDGLVHLAVFIGFLHGAYFSGVRAADEIRDLVRGNSREKW